MRRTMLQHCVFAWKSRRMSSPEGSKSPAYSNTAGRPSAVLLYAGDFDPSGEDILRDFHAKTQCWSIVRRIALTASQVEHYKLPEAPGKSTDTRAAAFVSSHGRLCQVELDALPVDV